VGHDLGADGLHGRHLSKIFTGLREFRQPLFMRHSAFILNEISETKRGFERLFGERRVSRFLTYFGSYRRCGRGSNH
jgi:hypothetical protein